jgi:hypothetical protein
MSGYDDKADSELFTFSLQKPVHVQEFIDVIKTVEKYQEIVQS